MKLEQTNSLHKEHVEPLIELKKNKNIAVLHPDKGSGVVILNRVEYIREMEALISNPPKFQNESTLIVQCN